VVTGSVVSDSGVVFVFPGQGSQWVGMAVELLDVSPVFAGWMGRCGEALGGFVDWDLLEVVRGVSGAPSLGAVDVVQPVLWAVMVSLAGLWRSCGVVPSAVVGHSQGEIAAAVVAGGLSLVDGARVVVLRSRVIGEELAGGGGMLSVGLSAEGVGEFLVGAGGSVELAAVNGPGSVVVSGAVGALEGLAGRLESVGVRTRRIPVDYASHSGFVEGVRERVLGELSGVCPVSGEVAFYSTVTGGLLDTAGLDAGYWFSNLRETVEFERVTRGLLADGHGVFVECSPHPGLLVGIGETVEAAGVGAVTVASLRRGEGGLERFVCSLAEAYVAGVPVDWSVFYAERPGERIDLPTYAFQHQRYW
ncbi:acyltransferase domain-containing protein, partial [Streptomyces sp. 110]